MAFDVDGDYVPTNAIKISMRFSSSYYHWYELGPFKDRGPLKDIFAFLFFSSRVNLVMIFSCIQQEHGTWK